MLVQSNPMLEPPVELEIPTVIERVEPVKRQTPKRITPKKMDAFETPATPATHALKPPSTEMHPSKFHPTTAEPSSALRLGFADIEDTRRRDSSHGAGLQSTPSKVGGVPSSAFTLRVPAGTTTSQLGLGAEALRVLEGLKEKAAEYKADLIANRENDSSSASTDANGRTIAKPKGRSGRFSAAHMAEFKKMDSIEGHASAWRAQDGRFVPVVKAGIKRSLSKANLDTPQKNTKQTERVLPATEPRKRTSVMESLGRFSAKRLGTKAPIREDQVSAKDEQPSLSAKRVKKSAEDDASTTRPVSRDMTSIPRPASSVKKPATSRIARPSLSRLMSPTKSSISRFTSPAKSEAVPAAVTSLPQPNFKLQGEAKESKGSKEPMTLKELRELMESKEPKESKGAKELARPKEPMTLKELRELIESKEPKDTKISKISEESEEPEEAEKVTDSATKRSVMKSVFGSSIFSPRRRSAIPQPVITTAQTPPASSRFSNLNITRLAATQPTKKSVKHVTFTPEVTRTIFDPDSPSPHKSNTTKKALERTEVEKALEEAKSSGDVAYPDLSSYKHLLDSSTEEVIKSPSPSVPGRFTFRSDHTIKFANPSPSGFGASPGQSSVRHVRNSIKATSDMPGSFPDPVSPSSHPNKENTAPSPAKVLPGVPHGMANKKRHRASSAEGDADKEAADRAGKKAKSSHVPEGQALVAPRLLGKSPSISASAKKAAGKTPVRPIIRAVSSASPSKKRPTLSMSRLNMLARPKNRG
ncbi:uncharacterized protein Triagg1_3102 [Trichoderma aggressivum f. europaeum]|uniref:Erythromycin esterase n=1 Tax=Trichoderma aggressivum f. europaeum TaxID=173218 RepID=A0AAE1IJE0_9HYPO|nr:hypothetical protein Triagg1_3102 [Trichoderma aggressivum f. europaeum]